MSEIDQLRAEVERLRSALENASAKACLGESICQDISHPIAAGFRVIAEYCDAALSEQQGTRVGTEVERG